MKKLLLLFLLAFLAVPIANYRAQNETYMCRSAENVVKCLCFNKLCAVG